MHLSSTPLSCKHMHGCLGGVPNTNLVFCDCVCVILFVFYCIKLTFDFYVFQIRQRWHNGNHNPSPQPAKTQPIPVTESDLHLTSMSSKRTEVVQQHLPPTPPPHLTPPQIQLIPVTASDIHFTSVSSKTDRVVQWLSPPPPSLLRYNQSQLLRRTYISHPCLPNRQRYCNGKWYHTPTPPQIQPIPVAASYLHFTSVSSNTDGGGAMVNGTTPPPPLDTTNPSCCVILTFHICVFQHGRRWCNGSPSPSCTDREERQIKTQCQWHQYDSFRSLQPIAFIGVQLSVLQHLARD